MHPAAVPEARERFQTCVKKWENENKPLIYIDESGFSVDMPRRYGWSEKGKRCYGEHSWHEKGRINVIGAMCGEKLITVSLFTGTINSEIFNVWVKEELLACIPAGSVIIMDNAPFHKRKDMQEAIKTAGHQLEYLPVYSPDLNPIEHKWAQAKALRRKHHCDVDTLFSGQLF